MGEETKGKERSCWSVELIFTLLTAAAAAAADDDFTTQIVLHPTAATTATRCLKKYIFTACRSHRNGKGKWARDRDLF